MAARYVRHSAPTEQVVKTRPEPVAALGGIVGPPRRAARGLDPLARVGRGPAERSRTPKTTPSRAASKWAVWTPGKPPAGSHVSLAIRRSAQVGIKADETHNTGLFRIFTKVAAQPRSIGDRLWALARNSHHGDTEAQRRIKK